MNGSQMLFCFFCGFRLYGDGATSSGACDGGGTGDAFQHRVALDSCRGNRSTRRRPKGGVGVGPTNMKTMTRVRNDGHVFTVTSLALPDFVITGQPVFTWSIIHTADQCA